MTAFRRLILAFTLILTGVAVASASAASDGIVVTDADSRVDLGLSYDPNLDNYLPFVSERIFIQWADSSRLYELSPIPNDLVLLLDQVLARIFVQWADSRTDYSLVYPVEFFGDTTPPTITDIVVQAGIDSVTVSWDTDEYADSRLECGSQPSLYTLEAWDPPYTYSRELILSSLIPGETYYCQISSTDRSGNEARSDEFSFAVVLDAPTLQPIDNIDQDGDYTVSWSSVADASSYKLEEQYNSGGWTTIYTGTQTTIALANQIEGDWCYRVFSSVNSGDSGPSNVECTAVDLSSSEFSVYLPIIIAGATSPPESTVQVPASELPLSRVYLDAYSVDK